MKPWGIHRLLNGNLKYLLLVPILFMIAFAAFYRQALTEIEQQIISEKMNEKRMKIELISTSIDMLLEQTQEGNAYDCLGGINAMVEQLDRMDAAFAAQYDGELTLLSERSDIAGLAFDPLQFTEFKDAVTGSESGDIELSYQKNHTAYVHYRWVSTDPTRESRSLLVIGVEESGVSEQQARLTTGVMIQVVITGCLNIAFIVLLCYLGFVYVSRDGSKWRAPE